MKKIFTTLLMLLFLGYYMQAQTFWSYDFQTSNTVPTGWQAIDNSATGTDGTWVFNNPRNRPFFSSTAANGIAILDSDNFGNGKTQNADLISPSVTINNTDAILSFDQYFKKAYDDGDTCRLSMKVNTNDWVLIEQWVETAEGTFKVKLDTVTTLANGDNVQFKWNFVGNYDWYWIIDNIKLYIPSDMAITGLNHVNGDKEFFMIGETNAIMAKINITTDGELNPINSFKLNCNLGQSTKKEDITKAKIYKGEEATDVKPENKITEIDIINNDFILEANTELSAENNHFLIVYDISDAATENDSIDLAINSLQNGANTTVPDVVNPSKCKYIKGGLQGTYTISGTTSDNPDYATITAAINDLKTVGIQSSVVFEIKSGTYEEFLKIGKINGTSDEKTITFKGVGENPDQVILTSNAGYTEKNTILFDNTDHIKIENLTITSKSTHYFTLVQFKNEYNNISFLKVKFIGKEVNNNTFNDDKTLVFDNSKSKIDKNLLFDSCSFTKGYIAIHAQGQGYNKPNDENITIKNSIFSQQYSKALYISYSENIKIQNNTIENTNATSVFGYVGMDLYRNYKSIIVSGNKLNIASTIKYFYGIKCRPCVGTPTEPVIIKNNMITGKGEDDNYSYALYIDDDKNKNIFILNNTVQMQGSSTKNRILRLGNIRPVTVQNNIFVNTSSQGGICWLKSKNMTDVNIDYNRYQSTSGYFGRYGTDYIYSFNQWKDSTNADSHTDTLIINTLFINNTDLHIKSKANMTVANPLSMVTNDIDGEARSTTTPCAGADEISDNTPPYLDIAFDTVRFENFPETKIVNLNGHFVDTEGDEITIMVKSISNSTLFSTEIQGTNLVITRLAKEKATDEWVKLEASSAGQTTNANIVIEMNDKDQAPTIASQIAPTHFSNFPDSVTIELSGKFTDPDDDDNLIEFSIQSVDNNFISASITDKKMKVIRSNRAEFNNKKLVLRATSNSKSVDMDVIFSGTKVVIPLEIADFEDITLNSDSIWAAPNEGVNYLINKTWKFYNFTKPTYWGGFQVSSRKDTSKTGMNAQYTAVTGKGFDNSDKYMVSYASYYPTDIFPMSGNATEIIKGMYVTNNLWTYKSIKNGDSYATPFGGESGNDQDYYRIKAVGYNADNSVKDSIYFYLADYRFDDNSKDYIVTDWQYFDLSPLGEVAKIFFKTESTKVNEYGMVTPAYFCLDNLHADKPDQAPIVKKDTTAHLTTTDNMLSINLLDIVTDPDNDDNLISFVITGGTDNNVADINISDKTLTIKRIENKHGSLTLKIMATSNGKTVDFEIPVTVDKILAICNIENNNIVCYPNPTTSILNIKNISNGSYMIVASNGQIVQNGQINSNSDSQINVENLSNGLYKLVISNNGVILNATFIKN